MSTVINLRIDNKTKDQANKVCKELGISLSSSIKIFLNQMIKQQGLPFTVSSYKPTKSLVESMKQADKIAKDPNWKTYDDVDKMIKEFGSNSNKI